MIITFELWPLTLIWDHMQESSCKNKNKIMQCVWDSQNFGWLTTIQNCTINVWRWKIIGFTFHLAFTLPLFQPWQGRKGRNLSRRISPVMVRCQLHPGWRGKHSHPIIHFLLWFSFWIILPLWLQYIISHFSCAYLSIRWSTRVSPLPQL